MQAGDGRVVVLEGPSGIGKTELLRTARECSQAAGLTTLTARGGEFERKLPFGVARQLLEPVLRRAGEDERALLLAGAGGLAEQVLAPAATAAGPPLRDPSYQALHGMYWLVANLAGVHGPVAFLVDDLQWADDASLRFLSFLARRVDELPVLLCVALRSGGDAARVAELIRGPLARSLWPHPLGPESVAELAAARFAQPVDGKFAAVCHEVTGGNPSLLRELLIALQEGGVRPVAGQHDRVREMGPETISDAVMHRLAGRPQKLTTLAAAAAVLGEETGLDVAAALAGLALEDAGEAVDELVAAEILADGIPLSFVHPVVRAAIYSSLAPAERAELHMRAAEILLARGAPDATVASHLLHGGPAGSAEIAGTLLRAGEAAVDRGAPAAGAAFLRRALSEPPPDELRGPILLALGTARARLGQPHAAEVLQEAIEAAATPDVQARAALECGRVLMISGRALEGVELLERIAARLRRDAPELARMLEAEQLISGHAFRSVRERLTARLGTLDDGAEAGTSIPVRVLLGIAAIEEACAGDRAERAAEHARRALGGGELLAALGPEAPAFYQPACALSISGHSDEAAAVVTGALEMARELGSATGFAIASAARSWVNLHRGMLDEAEADARQALTVDTDTWLYVMPMAVGTLVEVLVEQGRLAEAEEVAAGAPVAGPATMSVLYEILLGARGRIALAAGDPAAALERFREVGRRQQAWGATTPSIFNWRAHAALAHLAIGDTAIACELADAEVAIARPFGATRMLGSALRVAGLCRDGEAGLTLLREAVDVLSGACAPLELARASIDLGAALHRAGRSDDARDALRTGLDLAYRCRAGALIERSTEHLHAAGARPRRAVISGTDALTASERRISHMAAAGASNREIAQALFLSLRTVEFHLTNAYRKLGVAHRADLAQALDR